MSSGRLIAVQNRRRTRRTEIRTVIRRSTSHGSATSERVEFGERANERIGPMGLLPCLRRGSERWWLPLSEVATEAIGQVMLAVGRGDSIDATTQLRLHHAICSDPPLMIFAALCFTEQQATTSEIAEILSADIVGRFASGDAFLGAPVITRLASTSLAKAS